MTAPACESVLACARWTSTASKLRYARLAFGPAAAELLEIVEPLSVEEQREVIALVSGWRKGKAVPPAPSPAQPIPASSATLRCAYG